jgi:hypothetical protein
MACSLYWAPLASLSLVGHEHGRTILLADITQFRRAEWAPAFWSGGLEAMSEQGLAAPRRLPLRHFTMSATRSMI